jgi:hypothetical protein
MNRQTLTTADDMRRLLRARRRGRRRSWLEVLGSDIPAGVHTKEEMLGAFRAKLRAQGDRGALNLTKNLLLEPRNPFEPGKRRLPKREIVAVAALVAVLFGAVLWFNLLGR